MRTRAERRQRTLRVAAKRRATHLRQVHRNDIGQVDCVCELAAFYFEDLTNGCGCRKHARGAPRRGGGMCKHWSRMRLYQWRMHDREFCKGIVSRRLDRDTVEPSHRGDGGY